MTYAIARINHPRPTDDPAAVEHRRQFAVAHAAQPGFLGSLALPVADGGELVVNLWRDEPSARAALPVLAAAINEHLTPLLAAPSQFLGAGTITGLDTISQTSTS